jgi:phosphoenolpyruvate-protein phosphotransferase
VKLDTTERVYLCQVIAPGRVQGRLCVLNAPSRAQREEDRPSGPRQEARHFRRKAAQLARDLRRSADELEAQSMAGEAQILRMHVALLQDRLFHQRICTLIETGRQSADEAATQVLQEMAQSLADSGDTRMAERAADLRDLAEQLSQRLLGRGTDLAGAIAGVEDPIVAMTELLPSTVLKARAAGVLGFVVMHGTPLSHAAILAKSFGLPVVRVPALEELEAAKHPQILLDADNGRIVVGGPQVEKSAAAAQPSAPVPALPVKLWLSIVDPDQLQDVDWTGVEGVGLYRTEVLFMQHARDLPGEQEQVEAYRRFFAACGRRPAVLRTADIGADKIVAQMALGPQENPYLGLRAHRLFRFHPEILTTQVRAALLAAAGEHRLRLMFPMLETLDQWYFVQHLVRQAVNSLREQGAPMPGDFEQGLLVETPSAAAGFRQFLDVVDFAAVGTNDLVQYFFAVERDAANVAQLYRPEHPLMLRLLWRLARLARWAGKDLSVCGEIAADATLGPLLMGLGIEHFSVAPTQLTRVRQHLAAVSLQESRELARRCLSCRTADQVREILGLPSISTTDEVPAALPPGQTVDPVCGMILQTQEADLNLLADGHRYYFCSKRCLRRFRQAG